MRTVYPLDATAISDTAEPPAARPAVVLHGRWFVVSRIAFALFTLLAIWLIAMMLVRAAQSAGGFWLAGITDPEEAQAARANGGIQLVELIAVAVFEVLRVTTFFGVAALLVWRSRELIALFVAVLLVSSAATDYPGNLFDLMATEPVRAVLGLCVTYCFPLMLLVIFYIFPDGRFTPRWTIVPSIYWAGSLAWTFFVQRKLESTGGWHDLIVPGLLVASVVIAQVFRYRRVSGPLERQQTKWFLGGLGVLLFTFVGGNIALGATGGFNENVSSNAATVWSVFEAISTLAGIGLALSLAVAVLKYRLFDLNLIVNRALVYGGLTASVVGIYVLVVGYLGTLFRTGGNLLISLVATALVAISFQPLRDRLQRGANRLLYGQRDEPYAVVAKLGRQLESSLVPDQILPAIVETVATALKLPYVAIALRQRELVSLAAETGIEPASSLEVVPLVYQGERVGELRLAPRAGERTLAPVDRRLVDDLARQAGVAVHAVQLTRDLQRARERLVTSREEERRRLRRDLHDGLGPTLASQALTIDTARLMIEQDPRTAASLLLEAKAQSRAAVSEIRRVVYELRPPALDDLGLEGALKELAGQFDDTNLRVTIEMSEPLPKLTAAVEVAAYRIVQEALTNVARHARARNCVVNVSADSALALSITDDGIGIPENRRAGVGLSSMRERAEELGGRFWVDRGAAGGTVVTARLPG